ncbi:MAG: hypothetical protein PHC64_06140 [Candidatus Gastranaerophilales bacterium]|nr:hypothetical protein [Candidatus Gastranaerophilales bacterium]
MQVTPVRLGNYCTSQKTQNTRKTQINQGIPSFNARITATTNDRNLSVKIEELFAQLSEIFLLEGNVSRLIGHSELLGNGGYTRYADFENRFLNPYFNLRRLVREWQEHLRNEKLDIEFTMTD